MANIEYMCADNEKIVGYEVEETVWDGKPNLSGWDTVKYVQIHSKRFLTQELAEKWIEKNAKSALCNYFVKPIVVLCEI
jgi:hypothetical protein